MKHLEVMQLNQGCADPYLNLQSYTEGKGKGTAQLCI